jgi:hypothetical protein
MKEKNIVFVLSGCVLPNKNTIFPAGKYTSENHVWLFKNVGVNKVCSLVTYRVMPILAAPLGMQDRRSLSFPETIMGNAATCL